MTKIARLKPAPEQDSAVSERDDEKITSVVRTAAMAGADVAREGVEAARSTAAAAEGVYETTRRLAEDSPEVGRAFAALLGEQTRQGMDTLSAFARAVNWTEVADAQRELIAGSWLRISQFNARYGAMLLHGMTATAKSARR